MLYSVNNRLGVFTVSHKRSSRSEIAVIVSLFKTHRIKSSLSGWMNIDEERPQENVDSNGALLYCFSTLFI